jgi:DNA (cytosine-5)-methyltransferase 1
MKPLTSLEICAGAGGQALGLESAGFEARALVEIDPHCCNTLRYNRPQWRVVEGDVHHFDATPYRGVDLLAGGVPCPPFSKAGKQLGQDDERDLFPQALRLVEECRPKAVMLENVRGFLDAVFDDYRGSLKGQLEKLGYRADWRLLNASDFGVSQLRPRVVIVALRKDLAPLFSWPQPEGVNPQPVGALLLDLMAARGWRGAKAWAARANDIAPTIVGGSKKHGGPDLGPTRARKAWATLGVDGIGIANEVPDRDFVGMPRLTVEMVARIQGFPDSWTFTGKKTPAYRQIGNAFPPPVAQAVASQIYTCLSAQLGATAIAG